VGILLVSATMTMVMAMAMVSRSVVTTGSVMTTRSVVPMTAVGSTMEGAASPTSETGGSLTVERESSVHVRVGWERRRLSVMGKRTRRGRPIAWWWVCRTSRNVLTATLMRGSVLGKQTNDVPNGLSDLRCCVNICVSRAGRKSIDVRLGVRCRTTNFLRSTVELIVMRSPIGTVSDVVRDAPQPGDELRVLRKHGGDYTKECSDISGKSMRRPSGGMVEFCERRVWDIMIERGIGRWNLLDIDRGIGGERGAMIRNFVYMNTRFLWGVVGEASKSVTHCSLWDRG